MLQLEIYVAPLPALLVLIVVDAPVRVLREYERAVVSKFGRFQSVKFGSVDVQAILDSAAET